MYPLYSRTVKHIFLSPVFTNGKTHFLIPCIHERWNTFSYTCKIFRSNQSPWFSQCSRKDNFPYYSFKTYVMTLIRTISPRKIVSELSSVPLLISSSVSKKSCSSFLFQIITIIIILILILTRLILGRLFSSFSFYIIRVIRVISPHFVPPQFKRIATSDPIRPAGTWLHNDVWLTSMPLDDVTSISVRRQFGVMCPLGGY